MNDTKLESPQYNLDLGMIDGFRYILFEPPITNEQFVSVPMPENNIGFSYHVGGVLNWSPVIFTDEDDLIHNIGFNSDSFVSNDSFVDYAKVVAKHLGSAVVNPQILNL